jgi:hypothetical protein
MCLQSDDEVPGHVILLIRRDVEVMEQDDRGLSGQYRPYCGLSLAANQRNDSKIPKLGADMTHIYIYQAQHTILTTNCGQGLDASKGRDCRCGQPFLFRTQLLA